MDNTLCHSERSEIIREANDLAQSRNLLFACATKTLDKRQRPSREAAAIQSESPGTSHVPGTATPE